MSADSLSCYSVGQSFIYDACAENYLIAAIICKKGIDKEGESSSSLSLVPSEVKRSLVVQKK